MASQRISQGSPPCTTRFSIAEHTNPPSPGTVQEKNPSADPCMRGPPLLSPSLQKRGSREFFQKTFQGSNQLAFYGTHAFTFFLAFGRGKFPRNVWTSPFRSEGGSGPKEFRSVRSRFTPFLVRSRRFQRSSFDRGQRRPHRMVLVNRP